MRARILGYVGAGLLALLLLHLWQKRGENESRWDAEVWAFLGAKHRTEEELTRVRGKLIQQARATAAAELAAANVQHDTVRIYLPLLEAATTPADSLRACIPGLRACLQEVAHLRSVVDQDSVAIGLLAEDTLAKRRRILEAEGLLAHAPKPCPKVLGFLPVPDAIAGYGLVVSGGLRTGPGVIGGIPLRCIFR